MNFKSISLFALFTLLLACSGSRRMAYDNIDLHIDLFENNTPGMLGVVGMHLFFPKELNHVDYGTLYVSGDSFPFEESRYLKSSSVEVKSLYKAVEKGGIAGIKIGGGTQHLKEPVFFEFEIPNPIQPVKVADSLRVTNLKEDLKIEWESQCSECEMEISLSGKRSYGNDLNDLSLTFHVEDNGTFSIPKESLAKFKGARVLHIHFARHKRSWNTAEGKRFLVEFTTRAGSGQYRVVE
ncbi:MAG: hypothetical protein EP332_00070 [Bacteroidetes bacterium]|nr:MAG: hypothetical protein EP332_00070 [Bacteroidota bacterium]